MKFNKSLLPILFSVVIASLFVLIPASAQINFEGAEEITLIPDRFSDVISKHDNVKAIDYLREGGVLIGYSDGTFQPDSSINRAEFLKIVMEVSEFEPRGDYCYPDVQDQWFAKYVCSAKDNGLVEGYPNGRFHPERNINIAEASKIVANMLEIEVEDLPDADTWFKQFILSLEEKEAIPADIDTFGSDLTRGQMSEMIWRIDADRTYKLSKTYENIERGQDLSDELKNFGSCQELHDFFEDNMDEPYGGYLDAVSEESIPADAIATTPQMGEKGGCFTEKTQILMADGSHKSIRDIQVGDEILTRAEEVSAELVPAKVDDTVRHFVDGYLIINGNLEVTPEHIVFVNNEWDVAGSVEVGDFLAGEDGSEVEVYSVEESDESTWVYNFEVDDYHTYIANGLYVHNDKGGDASATNVQVQGVDEADIVKNDGEFIYFVKDDSVRIVDADPAATMHELDRIDYSDDDFYPSEIYVTDNELVVVGNTQVGEYYDDFEESLVDPYIYTRDGAAKIYVYDISDRSNVELIRDLAVEGDYDSSRRIGDVVYMVSSQKNYVWPWAVDGDWKEEDLVPLATEGGTLDKLVGCEDIMYMPRAIDEAHFMIVTAVPLDPNKDTSSQVVVGSSSDIYSSTENMYIAQEKYTYWGWYEDTATDEETFIHKFALDGSDIDYRGMSPVPGTVLNQFSMDEYKGYFRVVTTRGNVWDEENLSTNNLYILDENLNLTGSIEGLAPGERIYSSRFVGDRSYIVTFKKVDPLFVIDAANPYNPIVLGQLKIPGFSDYLHPYDENHIIGFGLDTEEASEDEIDSRGLDFAWFQGVKLAMFDVTNVAAPTELHREIIGDRGTSSPLSRDHKSLLYSTSRGVNGGALMAFPISVSEIPQSVKDDPKSPANTYGDYVFQGAYVYDVNVADGFNLRGQISHYDEGSLDEDGGYWYWTPKDVQRIIYIGDYFYTISQEIIRASEMDSPLTEVTSLTLSE